MRGGCWSGFFVINCMVLIVVVLLQSGKAADLAGAFGGAGSQTAFGPRGAANVLSKATTWCAIMFMLCAMALVLRTDRGVVQGGSVLQNVAQPKPAPAATKPAAPVTPVPYDCAGCVAAWKFIAGESAAAECAGNAFEQACGAGSCAEFHSGS